MISRYLFYKSLLIVIFSITYAFVEVKTPFYLYINTYIYRMIYFIFFFVISLVPSLTLTFSFFFYSMTLEDVFYWILDNELPFSYAWYYPVFHHIRFEEFFFSSRRRHTRWPRDWSSDVCSSDLTI